MLELAPAPLREVFLKVFQMGFADVPLYDAIIQAFNTTQNIMKRKSTNLIKYDDIVDPSHSLSKQLCVRNMSMQNNER